MTHENNRPLHDYQREYRLCSLGYGLIAQHFDDGEFQISEYAHSPGNGKVSISMPPDGAIKLATFLGVELIEVCKLAATRAMLGDEFLERLSQDVADHIMAARYSGTPE